VTDRFLSDADTHPMRARQESPRPNYATLSRPRRLALLDGGSSRRTTVMRLCPSGQPAHISLIRRRSRPIISGVSAPSGISIKREDPGRPKNHLTTGPPISVRIAGRGAAISAILHGGPD
jgi:hypothetical protein